MPLLNKRPLVQAEPPQNLNPDDKVYFLEASGEIFAKYDDFFDRMILLNSTEWSCGLTGKTGLTYFEALESEREARQELESFPDFMEAPILYMVQHLTCRGRLDDVLADVMAFMKDRYFIGEEVLLEDGRMKRAARIEAVHLIPDGEVYANKIQSKGRKTLKEVDIGLPAVEAYRYDVQIIDGESGAEEDVEESASESGGRRDAVEPALLSRDKNNVSKQKLRLFLKNSCVLYDKRQEVKENLRRDYLIDQMTWDAYYADPKPFFPQTPLLVRGRPCKTPKEEKTPKEKKVKSQNISEEKTPKEKKIKTPHPASEGPKKKGRPRKSENLPPETTKSEPASPRKMSEKKRKQIETQQEEIRPSIETAKRLGVEDVSRWEQSERVLTPTDIEELKEAIKEGRAREREEYREKKKREREAAAEWRKPRDDLLCDDLKPLPDLRPLPLPPWMPAEEFGDYLSLFHFFLSFQELLPIKEFRGTSRLSFSDIVIAIRCRDPQNSSLADIIRIIMTVKCERTEEEDGDEANLNKPEEVGLRGEDLDHPEYGDRVRGRNALHEGLRDAFGESVRHLPIDWMTMTEVVRLHLLTSGYYTGITTFRHHKYQRGGIRCYEDAGFQFCERFPDIMARLETHTLFDLTPTQRLELLKALVEQLMSYHKFRQYHDDRVADLVEKKRKLKKLRLWMLEQEKEGKDAVLLMEVEQEAAEKGEKSPQKKEKPSKETIRLKGYLKALREGRKVNEYDLMELCLAGIAFKTLDLEECVQAREEQRKHYDEAEAEVIDAIHDLEGISCLVHLGRDRAYRSYFFLEGVPALLVEEADEWWRERSTICEETTPIADNTGHVNEYAARVAVLGCTGDESCPAHGKLARGRPRWSYIDAPEKVDQLFSACNPRGLREIELSDELSYRKEKLVQLVERTVRKVESGHLSSVLMEGVPDPAEPECTIDWAVEIRELILDIEEKVHLGLIGDLWPADVDREEWRRRLREDGDVTPLTKGDVNIRVEGRLKKEEDEERSEKEALWTAEQVEDLTVTQKYALALFQVFCSISLRFFKDPFAFEKNDVKRISEVFLCFQRQLAQSRSLPAIALCLYTLESSILWNMSRLQGKCRACRAKEKDAKKLVLCSECSNAYHLRCVRPVLEEAHSGWMCAECNAVHRREAAKAARAAAKEAEKQRAAVKEEEDDFEEGCYAATSQDSKNGIKTEESADEEDGDHDTKTPKAANGGSNGHSTPPVTTSSGRVVKRVFYTDNVESPFAARPRRPERRARERENEWSDEDDSNDSAEVYGGRSKRRREYHEDEHSLRNISTALRENTTVLKDRLTEVERAIKESIAKDFSWPFSQPVDKREVPDYYAVIKNPMDLRTMIQKIKNNVYDSLGEVQKDFDLILANCKIYNEEGSDIVEMSERLGSFLQPRLDSISSERESRRRS